MELSVKPIAQPARLADLAYNSLKDFILSSDLEQDQKLDERALAEQLGVSRTPLREAVHRLALEGFVRVEPRKGIFINYRPKEEIVEILYVRAALEGMAARLACKHITKKNVRDLQTTFQQFDPETVEQHTVDFALANVVFHEKVLDLSHSSKLIEFAANIRDQIRLVRIFTIRAGGRARNALLEHLSIIEALEQRDPDLSASRMREHILGLARHVEEGARFPWEKQKQT
jgi:DNA-binding GntR family transcriptional regulator